jgi:UDP-N-acetylglucosamine/UDP-N-acetylgalactosamine diphosphorylase
LRTPPQFSPALIRDWHNETAMDYRTAHQLLQDQGQLDVLRFWDTLDESQRGHLLADIEKIDWPLIRRLASESGSAALEIGAMHPPSREMVTCATAPEGSNSLKEAAIRGRQLIQDRRVAALTVAGGSGTRLGFDGPKGLFPITPIKNKTLFQHFAESIVATNKRYSSEIPWYVMTSPENHLETDAFFRSHNFFGLDPERVSFFQQGTMPALSDQGKVLLAERHRIALSPDGHGGTLTALSRSGALDDMTAQGIEYISYFQVDNPLVNVVDPLFVGQVHVGKSEVGSKVIRKAFDDEKVGVFATVDGRLRVIEYSDLPSELARQHNDDGSRTFDFANMAVHVFSLDYVKRLTAPGAETALPWHRARKKVSHVDPVSGELVEPESPNAIKLEQFIFDAIPLARQPLLLEVARSEEFSPVKNAAGNDSPETTRAQWMSRAKQWLKRCGRAVGDDVLVEISPLYALDLEELRAKLAAENLDPVAGNIYLGP